MNKLAKISCSKLNKPICTFIQSYSSSHDLSNKIPIKNKISKEYLQNFITAKPQNKIVFSSLTDPDQLAIEFSLLQGSIGDTDKFLKKTKNKSK
jgi:hypothetical protein